jgi:hypothetical protein
MDLFRTAIVPLLRMKNPEGVVRRPVELLNK